jgi:hypothetical protein
MNWFDDAIAESKRRAAAATAKKERDNAMGGGVMFAPDYAKKIGEDPELEAQVVAFCRKQTARCDLKHLFTSLATRHLWGSASSPSARRCIMSSMKWRKTT